MFGIEMKKHATEMKKTLSNAFHALNVLLDEQKAALISTTDYSEDEAKGYQYELMLFSQKIESLYKDLQEQVDHICNESVNSAENAMKKIKKQEQKTEETSDKKHSLPAVRSRKKTQGSKSFNSKLPVSSSQIV